MRVTQNMISRQYNRNLNNAFSKYSYATQQSTDYRAFYTAGENPMGYSKLFSYRQQISKNDTYQANVKNVQSRMDTAESSLTSINTMLSEISSTDYLKGVTGTTSAEDREVIATKILAMRETLISTANAKYGDDYLFGGSNSSDAPFTVAADGSVLYRGINVVTLKYAGSDGKGASCNVNNSTVDFGAANGTAFNGYSLIINDSTAPSTVDTQSKTITVNLDISGGTNTKGDLEAALQGLDYSAMGGSVDKTAISIGGDASGIISARRVEINGGADPIAAGTPVADMDALANEAVYVDIGLGLDVSSANEINKQSAFNTAIPGISFLGYGVSNGGIPNNLYVLMGDIASQLTAADFSMDKIQPYLDAFDTQSSKVLTSMTEIGAKTKFVEYTTASLTTQGDNLANQRANVEYIDTLDAIENYSTAAYSYKAALQAGKNLLQYSFLDFMD